MAKHDVVATWEMGGTKFRLVEWDLQSAHDDYVLEMREYDAAGGDRWTRQHVERGSLVQRALLAGLVELTKRQQAVAESMTYVPLPLSGGAP